MVEVIQDLGWLGNDARADIRDSYFAAGSTRPCVTSSEYLNGFFCVQSFANGSLLFRTSLYYIIESAIATDRFREPSRLGDELSSQH